MIIRNESVQTIHIGWTSQSGTTLVPSETTEIPDNLTLNNDSFKSMLDGGIISIVSYEDDDLDYVVQKELKDAVAGVGTHAIDHITAGTDEIDGDKLDIDWNPSNYSPDFSIIEADSIDNLSAHLKGIDTTLGSISGGVTDIVKNTTKTVGPSGKDYTTVSDALNFFNRKFCIQCAIEIDPGTYAGVDVDRILGSLVIRASSTRNYLCGCSWGHGITIRHGKGSGVASLSSSGNTITVSSTGSAPDFSNLQSGDTIFIRDSSLTRYDLTVSSGDASGNIVCTTAPPAGVNAEGASLTVYPLVEMTNTKLNDTYEWHNRVFFSGIHFSGGLNATSQSNLSKAENCMFNGISAIENSFINLNNNCTIYNNGITTRSNSSALLSEVFFIHYANASFMTLERDSYCSLYRVAILAPNRPLTVTQGSTVDGRQMEYFARYSPAIEVKDHGNLYASGTLLKDVVSCQIGAYASDHGFIRLEGSTIDGFGDGIRAWDNGVVNCYNATITNCSGTGIYANRRGYVQAQSTLGKMSGNGANYNPPTSLTPGNGEAVIYYT